MEWLKRLKPSTATNYDASAEFYGADASLFTIDVYYKQIENFIYAATVKTGDALAPSLKVRRYCPSMRCSSATLRGSSIGTICF